MCFSARCMEGYNTSSLLSTPGIMRRCCGCCVSLQKGVVAIGVLGMVSSTVLGACPFVPLKHPLPTTRHLRVEWWRRGCESLSGHLGTASSPRVIIHHHGSGPGLLLYSSSTPSSAPTAPPASATTRQSTLVLSFLFPSSSASPLKIN